MWNRCCYTGVRSYREHGSAQTSQHLESDGYGDASRWPSHRAILAAIPSIPRLERMAPCLVIKRCTNLHILLHIRPVGHAPDYNVTTIQARAREA